MPQSCPKTTIHSAVKHNTRLKPQVWFNRPRSNYPDAGWNHAIEGFAVKLAKKLGYEPCMVVYGELFDPPPKDIKVIQIKYDQDQSIDQALQQYLQKHGAPAIWLGSYGKDAGAMGNLSFRCDSRPDLGIAWSAPAMTHLTSERIQRAGQKAKNIAEWKGKLHDKKVLISVAEAHKLGDVDDDNPLITQVRQVLDQQDDLTLMITSSPRTDVTDFKRVMHEVQAMVEQAKTNGKHVDLIAQSYHDCVDSAYLSMQGKATEIPNRYEEMLGLADAIMILGESRSMLADALLTDAAIYVQNAHPCGQLPAEDRFRRGLTDFFGDEQAGKRISGGTLNGALIEKPAGAKQFDVTQHFVDETLQDYQGFCKQHPERVPAPAQSKAR